MTCMHDLSVFLYQQVDSILKRKPASFEALRRQPPPSFHAYITIVITGARNRVNHTFQFKFTFLSLGKKKIRKKIPNLNDSRVYS
jgi:hypothetical protein